MSAEAFSLDPRLQQDCENLGDLDLCRVLLMKDARYPWLILVPRRPGLREIHQLKHDEQVQLLNESQLAANALETLFQPDKLNIAALGNVVSQLHIHHIARFETDDAWPKPAWGAHPAEPYTAETLQKRCDELRARLFAK